MAIYYNGSLKELEKRKTKIVSKIEELNKIFNHNIPLKEQIVINNKIAQLSDQLEKIETEILKVQKDMQNSNLRKDETNNTDDLQF